MSPRRDDGEERDSSGRRTESDEELAALLSDLETTLGDLRRELDARDGREKRGPTDSERERYGYRPPERSERRDGDEEGRRRGRRGRRRESVPRPPSVGELLRFTEEYTIPTVVATLEATIRSLELLRRVLRLADPGRSTFGDARDGERTTVDRLSRSRMGRDALSGLDSALSEMRTALSEADLPEDEASRSVLEEARGLVAEIEARIDEAEGGRGEVRDADRRDREGRSDDGGDPARSDRPDGRRESVRIDVTDESEPDDPTAGDEDESPMDDRPKVDVEAELESIRREVRGESDPSAESEPNASPGEPDDESEGGADDGDRDGSDVADTDSDADADADDAR